MRRKSYKRKSAPRRRRRMSGIGAVGSTAMSVAYTIAGGVAAQLVGKVLPAGVNAKISAAIPVAVGLFLPRFVKGEAVKSVSNGMLAVGGLKLVQSFGVLNGIGAYNSYAGYQVPQVSGHYNNAGMMDTSYMTPSIAGMDEDNC